MENSIEIETYLYFYHMQILKISASFFNLFYSYCFLLALHICSKFL